MNLAARIPGKADYADVVRAYAAQLERSRARDLSPAAVSPREQLAAEGFDEIVIATGVKPARSTCPAPPTRASSPTMRPWPAVPTSGDRVAIIGAGGIGHDVAL